MRHFIVYLLYAAVMARAVAWMQDEGPFQSLIWFLLVLYGVLLLPQPFLSKRFSWFRWAYPILQSVLAGAILILDTSLEFIALLFFSLSFQVRISLPRKAAFAWFGLFSVLIAISILDGWDWEIDGLPMVLLFIGLNFFAFVLAGMILSNDKARNENQRMLEELQEAHSRLQGYTAQMEELATSRERSRMSREMHDSVTQTIFSMNLAAEAAQIQYQKDLFLVAPQLDRLQELANSAAGELKVLYSSAPVELPSESGLVAALDHLCTGRKDQLRITLKVLSRTCEAELSMQVTTGLYRIIHEALTNVEKHSGTHEAEVLIDLDAYPARISVQDHGSGFDPGKVSRSSAHIGLLVMIERAREIGWHLEVESAPGCGTTIRIIEGQL